MNPSPNQQAIFDAYDHTQDNLIIQACAGSGKTTTLKMLCERIPATTSVIALAFAKVNAEQFQAKLPKHVEACTTHSLGLRMIKSAVGKVEVRDDKQFAILSRLIEGKPVKRISADNRALYGLLSRCSSLCMATMTDPADMQALLRMLTMYGLSLTSYSDEDDSPTEITDLPTLSSLCVESLKQQRAQRNVLSFDDMIDHVVHFKLKSDIPYDVILGDEVQDWNKQQAAFVGLLASSTRNTAMAVSPTLAAALARRGMPTAAPVADTHVRPTKSRLILVGDQRQSMYAFRGAAHDSMARLKDAYRCTELPLSVCYRCPTSVIEKAQGIVGPEVIQARPDAPEGEIRKIGYSEAASYLQPGHLVMCRTNAPLVSLAMALLRQDKKPVIKGTASLEDGLNHLVLEAVVSDEAARDDLKAFVSALYACVAPKISKLIKDSVPRAVQLNDKYEAVVAIAEDCVPFSSAAVYDRIRTIMHGDGIVLSSIHRAKGVEADHCTILGYNCMPHPMAKRIRDVEARNAALVQEQNMQYVAVTRALKTLTFVDLNKLGGRDTTSFPDLNAALQ